MRSGGEAPKAKRVRLRLTAAGWVFVVVALVVLAAAIKSQGAIPFAILGAMVGALLASSILPQRMLRGVSIQREAPEQVWQNQTVHLGYYLLNRRRSSCLALQIEELPADGMQSARGFCAHLAPGGTFRSGARFVVRRRGRIRLSGVQVLTNFPFGLVRASRVVGLRHNVIVWPSRGKLKRQMLHQGAVEVSSGPPTQMTGGQDEFFGLRDYRVGDNPRWIHWRRSATRRVPVVREMCHPTPEILWVLLDTHLADDSTATWAARERAMRFAATMVEHALFRGYRVGLAMAYSDKLVNIRPGAGRGQLHLLLNALTDIDANTSRTLGDTVSSLRSRQLDRAQVLVVSASEAGPDERILVPARRASRNMTVIAGSQLDAAFEDDPLAAAEVG